MKDPEKNIPVNGTEDGMSADAVDPNKIANPIDDSFKTSPRKHRLGWEQPQDEQMFESFNDIREQRGEDEEAD